MARIVPVGNEFRKYLLLKDMLGGGFVENTAGNFTATPTQDDDGFITLPLAGGKTVASTTNPDTGDAAGVWGRTTLRSNRRVRLTGDISWGMRWRFMFKTQPSTDDNFGIGIVVSNTSDLTSGTIKALIATIEYSAAVGAGLARLRWHTLSDGTVANAVNSATPTALLMGMAGIWHRNKHGATGLNNLSCSRDLVPLLADGGRSTTGQAISATNNAQNTLGDTQTYLGVFAYRTLVTDLGDITPAFKLEWSPPEVW